MSKASRAEGLMKRAFAKKFGKTVRWAQKQAKANTIDWRNFISSFEVSKESESVESMSGVGGGAGQQDDLARATAAKNKAWSVLEQQQCMLDEYIVGGDADMIVALSKSVRECRAAWEKAQIHERKMKEASGAMVPVSAFNELRVRGVDPLGELVKGQRDFIGSRLQVAERQNFYRVWDEWSLEWNEKIVVLIKEVESIVNHV